MAEKPEIKKVERKTGSTKAVKQSVPRETKAVKPNPNLDLWNKVSETDPGYTKAVKYGEKGRSFTSVNATYQMKLATAAWGLYGTTWGVDEQEHVELHFGGNVLLRLVARFFYPGGSFKMRCTITLVTEKRGKDGSTWVHIDEDADKKLLTDFTTKALSKLGFNSDVFMGMYDDNKYINSLREKYAPAPTVTPQSQEQKPKPTPPAKNTKPWLNPGKGKWNDGVKYLASAAGTIEGLKSGYRISKANEEKIKAEALELAQTNLLQQTPNQNGSDQANQEK